MELINATRMAAGYTLGLEPSGRELLVVVIKGTFVLPAPGEAVQLHDKQLPLVLADTFTGAAGFSAPVHEADFATRKSACDVLLLGTAHAPAGTQVTRQRVGLRLGPVDKSFNVMGRRVWQAALTGIKSSSPEPFTRLPISYDVAFGGTDHNSEDQSEHGAYMSNPVGLGWHKHLKNAWIDGKPLPHTEETGRSVSFPSDRYKPMSFGPLGRGWLERARYAGTYDERWQKEDFPFLPKDFDERYFQAAPEDQQIPWPTKPMQVELEGVTPDGLRRFELPHFEAPVHVFPIKGGREDYTGVIDSIVFEPDQGRFTLTWRVVRPLQRSLFEIAQVMVGRRGPVWWREQDGLPFPIPIRVVPTGEPQPGEHSDV